MRIVPIDSVASTITTTAGSTAWSPEPASQHRPRTLPDSLVDVLVCAGARITCMADAELVVKETTLHTHYSEDGEAGPSTAENASSTALCDTARSASSGNPHAESAERQTSVPESSATGSKATVCGA